MIFNVLFKKKVIWLLAGNLDISFLNLVIILSFCFKKHTLEIQYLNLYFKVNSFPELKL